MLLDFGTQTSQGPPENARRPRDGGMPMFWIFGAVLHATAFAVIGFFVLFAASKTDGLLGALGKLLGAWLYLLAILAIACAVLMPLTGGHLFGMTMPERMGPAWMSHWEHHCGTAPAAPAAKAMPAVPAKPVQPASPG